jgi:ring-1,2-phenylacetyl-CoA epoxidase subunit PaaE
MSRRRFHALQISAIARETEDGVAVTLAIPPTLRDEFAFVPGQYLTVHRPGAPEDERRSYSICSQPGALGITLGVREIPGGVVSTWLNRVARVGDRLECMPPDGQFGAQALALQPRHLLLIAAGSGITPLLSIAESALAAHPKNRVTLLYGNRSVASMLFREALTELKDRYLDRFDLHCVFSREPQDIALHEGRLDGAKLRAFLARLIPVSTVDDALLCGPNAMLDEAIGVMLEAGLAASHIHVERFGAPDTVSPVNTTPHAVNQARLTLILDGKTRIIPVEDSRTTVLDAARAAGLDLPFSCRTGVCATCRAKVLAGEVEMARNFALLEDDLKAGIILTCQAHPVTAEVTVSFDDR